LELGLTYNFLPLYCLLQGHVLKSGTSNYGDH